MQTVNDTENIWRSSAGVQKHAKTEKQQKKPDASKHDKHEARCTMNTNLNHKRQPFSAHEREQQQLKQSASQMFFKRTNKRINKKPRSTQQKRTRQNQRTSKTRNSIPFERIQVLRSRTLAKHISRCVCVCVCVCVQKTAGRLASIQ